VSHDMKNDGLVVCIFLSDKAGMARWIGILLAMNNEVREEKARHHSPLATAQDASQGATAQDALPYDESSAGLQITPPADLGASQHAWSFEITTTKDQHTPAVVETNSTKALKGTKKVDLDGHH